MRQLSPWLLALGACDASPGTTHAATYWSGLRDALTLGHADPVARARVVDARARAAVSAPLARGVLAVAAIDRELALDGEDALVAARYASDGDVLVASQCGPLFDGRGEADLAAWLARCGGDPMPRVEAVGSMATSVAWLPDEGRVLVHPALLAGGLATVRAALTDGGSACLGDLASWCERCPTGSETGCDPLFGRGTDVVSCANLDALTEPDPGSSDPPKWRTLYCAWRALETVPQARLAIASHDFRSNDGVACWEPTIPVCVDFGCPEGEACLWGGCAVCAPGLCTPSTRRCGPQGGVEAVELCVAGEGCSAWVRVQTCEGEATCRFDPESNATCGGAR